MVPSPLISIFLWPVSLKQIYLWCNNVNVLPHAVFAVRALCPAAQQTKGQYKRCPSRLSTAVLSGWAASETLHIVTLKDTAIRADQCCGNAQQRASWASLAY